MKTIILFLILFSHQIIAQNSLQTEVTDIENKINNCSSKVIRDQLGGDCYIQSFLYKLNDIDVVKMMIDCGDHKNQITYFVADKQGKVIKKIDLINTPDFIRGYDVSNTLFDVLKKIKVDLEDKADDLNTLLISRDLILIPSELNDSEILEIQKEFDIELGLKTTKKERLK
ncbi:hypothetical protein MY04_5494 [Flammeovirga sp. MY04]|uniref:hypothetical protein n=1 Tax=Flammeovirga sp. MY04 TaxID=1191459 RepID=UPI0008062EC3|nr:hypothetical protein [Flammeovirga sp. MY04]ANQ52825.1 hypothetical protein MY04_5494 [Flammeovirga sp. MY04]